MKTTSRPLLVAFGLMLLLPAAAASYVLFVRGGTDTTQPTASTTVVKAPRNPWPRGREARFRLDWEGETHVDIAAGNGGVDASYGLSGELVVQSLGEIPEGTLLSLSLATVDSCSMKAMGAELVRGPEDARALLVGREAWLIVGRDGELRRLYHRPEDPGPWKDVSRSLASHLSMTVPDDDAGEWTVSELGELGRAQSHYRRSRAAYGGQTLSREHVQWEQLFAQPAGGCPRCREDASSRGTIALDPSGAPVTIDEGDRVTLAPPGDTPVMRAKAVFQLRRVAVAEVALASQLTFDASKLEAHAPGERRDDKPGAREMLARRIGGLTEKQVFEGLDGYATTGKMPTDPGFMTRASGLLLADPSLCGAVARRFERADNTVRGRALALDLLTSAGSTEAQAALRQALASPAARADQGAYPLLLQRLSLLARPDAETTRFAELTLARASRDTAGVRDAAAYMVGAVAGKLVRAGEESQARPLADTLSRGLAQAESARDRATWVGALGSTRLPEVVPTLARAAHDGAPPVRQATAQALGEIHTPEARTELMNLLGDGDFEVQLSALKSLGEQELRPEDMHALAHTVQDGRTDVKNDSRLVGFLAEHPRETDDVRATLTFLLGRTTDPRLAGRIRFVLSQLPES